MTLMRRIHLLILALLCAVAPAPVAAQSGADAEGAAGLGLALRRLGNTARVLMIGAHPDDENTALLAELALGSGADVAYLSLTRGEGGQNLIGPELEEGLGLIRSEELLAARRLDGAQQFFTRANDYGFSKSADEAFSQWPRDSLLADVVAVVRTFRPDIILAVFSGTPRDGHGQHQASGIMAREAFEAAGDPSRFPGQIAAGLTPHQPAYLFQSLWRGGDGEAVRIQTGELDRLLGRSRYQIAMASRSRHRSQDMGRAEPIGPQSASAIPVLGDFPEGGQSLFAGLDTTLAQRANGATDGESALDAYERIVLAARDAFNPLDAGALVPQLMDALAQLDRARAGAGDALAFHLETERAQLVRALRMAAGLVFEVTAEDARVVPGQTFEMTLTLWNGGDTPLRVHGLAPVVPEGWNTRPLGEVPNELAARAVARVQYAVTLPVDAEPTEPYFLREQRTGEMYTWPASLDVRGQPFAPPQVRASADIELGSARFEMEEEAVYVDVDKARGETRRPLMVLPALGVRVQPATAVVPTDNAGGTVPLTILLRSEATDTLPVTLDIQAPAGWTVEAPPARTVAPGEESSLTVTLRAPASLAAGRDTVRVIARTPGAEYDRGYTIIDYPHIRAHALFAPSSVALVACPVALPDGIRVGYIEGAGDDGADALRQMGATVERLDAAMLADGDLSRFDAIVTGIRAYEVRPDLIANNRRLLDYARTGGTFVVQYNKYELPNGGFAPYPFTMSRPHGRVTDENAAVTFTNPDHPALNSPNRIGPSDFEGWVQERGLYFAGEWSPEYTTLLAMSDPGEAPLEGSVIIAPLGEGHYVYSGLAFFRQIPAGVCGAYRLLANLVSLSATTGR